MAFQLFPSFNFNESNVGPRPVRTVNLDRVAMAAQFNYGPAVPTLADADDALKLFGQDTSVGSVHLQAIFDQGPSDILLSRVLPSARVATKSATLTGTIAGAGTMTVSVKNGANPTVTFDFATTNGQTASALVTAIVAAFGLQTGLPLAAAVDTGNSGTTGKIKFTANEAGDDGNDLQVSLVLTTSTGITYSPVGIGTTLTNLAGGYDAPTRSSIVLDDEDSLATLTLTELSYGTGTNGDTKAVISDSLEDDRFNLVLSSTKRKIVETYNDVDLTDVYNEDQLMALKASVLARGTVTSSAKVPVAGTFSFAGGTDGDSTITTEDFIAAIDALEELPATVVCCPGIKPAGVVQTSINATLLAQVEAADTEMGELMGLRIACLSTPRGTVRADLPGLKTDAYIPDSQRVLMNVGWGTSTRQPKYKQYGVDGAALRAGQLVMLRHHISPAAMSSAPTIKGISEIDTPNSVGAWNDITRYRLDAIIIEPVSGSFRVLNGRSTSSDPAWYDISTRRIFDKIRTNIFFNFQYIKSEPSNPKWDRIIMAGVDAMLDDMIANEEINGYDPTVSDDRNNSAAVRGASMRYVDTYIEPVYPNHKVQWNLNRVQRASIRVA